MYYRTRTYLAGDWTGDQDLIQTLKKWNDSDYWGLTFSDTHDLMQSYDTSMPCSIKRSLHSHFHCIWQVLQTVYVYSVGTHTVIHLCR